MKDQKNVAPAPRSKSPPPPSESVKPSAHSSAIDRAMKANPTLTRERAEEMAKALGF